MDESKMFVQRLRCVIAESGETQRQIAKEVGVAKATVNLWCRGEQMPNSKALIKLCERFDVSADWLLGLSNFRRLKK